MTEHNALGARVATRPLWTILVWGLLLGPIYRLWWLWRAASDLDDLARLHPEVEPARGLRGRPAAAPLLLALGMVGWGMLTFAALPWGGASAPDWAGGGDPGAGTRITVGLIGLALLVPAVIALLRLRRRVALLRKLAGGGRPTIATRRSVFVPLLLLELVAVPAWLLALQHDLNGVWRSFPDLEEEDLYGRLAPPGREADLDARRRDLHVGHLGRVATRLEHPERVPLVTMVFLAACLVAWAFQLAAHGFFPTGDDLERVGALRTGIDGTWWRVFSAAVLHGSIQHLVGNMFLWTMIGALLERTLGHARMLVVVALGAAGASAGHLLGTAADAPAVGASGVLFAAFGAAAMSDPRARTSLGRAGWVFSVLGIGLSTFAPGVGSWAHVGGIVTGAVLAVAFRLVWPVRRVPVALASLPARPQPVDPTAPLAPDRVAGTQERLAHLAAEHAAGRLSPDQFDRLRAALAASG